MDIGFRIPVLLRTYNDGSGEKIAMDSKDIVCIKQIKNALGLHARPASIFVQTACNFKSAVIVEKDSDSVNGKSLMGLLMLAAGYGSDITLKISGEDAEQACKALSDLIDNKFNEE